MSRHLPLARDRDVRMLLSHALVLAETLGAVGDGGLAGFGTELAARATPEALARHLK